MGYKKIVLTEKDEEVTTSSTVSPIMKQLDKFDTAYSSRKFNELLGEYDSVTITEKLPAEKTISQVVPVAVTSAGVSFKTKLYIGTAAAVAILLFVLVIYNIFVINGLNQNISLLQGEVAEAAGTLSVLEEENILFNSTDSIINAINEAFGGEFTATGSQVVEVEKLVRVTPNKTEPQTNWFDAFCNFFSNLFGG